MKDRERPNSAFRFTDRRQERIHRRLLLIGPGPGADRGTAIPAEVGGPRPRHGGDDPVRVHLPDDVGELIRDAEVARGIQGELRWEVEDTNRGLDAIAVTALAHALRDA